MLLVILAQDCLAILEMSSFYFYMKSAEPLSAPVAAVVLVKNDSSCRYLGPS